MKCTTSRRTNPSKTPPLRKKPPGRSRFIAPGKGVGYVFSFQKNDAGCVFSVLIVISPSQSLLSPPVVTLTEERKRRISQDGGDTAPECYTRAFRWPERFSWFPGGAGKPTSRPQGATCLLPLLVVVSLRAVGVRPLQSHFFFFQ